MAKAWEYLDGEREEHVNSIDKEKEILEISFLIRVGY